MGEKGWTMPTVPKEYGGGGLSKEEVKILNEEMFAIGARQPCLVSVFGCLLQCSLNMELRNKNKNIYLKLSKVKLDGVKVIPSWIRNLI